MAKKPAQPARKAKAKKDRTAPKPKRTAQKSKAQSKPAEPTVAEQAKPQENGATLTADQMQPPTQIMEAGYRPHPGGRPTDRPTAYSEELAASLLEHMGNGGSANSWCKDPAHWTFATMLRHAANVREFGELYARAREAQADAIFDEVIDIADDDRDDWVETDHGPRFNKEAAARSRIRVEARLKVAARLNPRKYAEKLDLTIDDKRLDTPDARRARIAELMALGFVPAAEPADVPSGV